MYQWIIFVTFKFERYIFSLNVLCELSSQATYQLHFTNIQPIYISNFFHKIPDTFLRG